MVSGKRQNKDETIINGNWNEWSTIQGVIGRVISYDYP